MPASIAERQVHDLHSKPSAIRQRDALCQASPQVFGASEPLPFGRRPRFVAEPQPRLLAFNAARCKWVNQRIERTETVTGSTPAGADSVLARLSQLTADSKAKLLI